MKVVYPENYNDEDKAIYLDLITRGKQLLGTEIGYDEEYLLDLSAKITINKMRGYDNGLSQEEVEEIKKIHKSNMSGTFQTPSDMFYEGLIRTEAGTMEHPLMKKPEEVYKEHQTKPDDDDVIEEADPDNYLVKQVKMLEIN
jgi:hypothetical protein